MCCLWSIFLLNLKNYIFNYNLLIIIFKKLYVENENLFIIFYKFILLIILILVFVSLPTIIFNGFLVERTKERMIGFAISAAAAVIILGIGMLISKLFNKKDPIADFATCFSNPGFFGIPLIVATLVEGSVFYIATFIFIF